MTASMMKEESSFNAFSSASPISSDLVFVRSILGAVTCGSAANKFKGSQIAFTQVLLLLLIFLSVKS